MEYTYEIKEEPIEVLLFKDDVLTHIQPYHPEAENLEPWASKDEAIEWATEQIAQFEQEDIDHAAMVAAQAAEAEAEEETSETPTEE